jgi:hypothetical protein
MVYFYNGNIFSSMVIVSIYRYILSNMSTSYTLVIGLIQNRNVVNITKAKGKLYCHCAMRFPRVVTGEKNSPTVAYACRKRRLKWVLTQVGGWSTELATLSLCKKFNRYRNLNNFKVVEPLCSSGNEEN